MRPSPSLRRDPISQAESPNIICEVDSRFHGSIERDPSAWARPLEKWAIGFPVLDHRRVRCAPSWRRWRCRPCASGAGCAGPGHVAFELVAKAVGSLQRGGLTRDPESVAQARVAVFQDLALATKHPRLDGGEVHAAEPKELAVVPEPPHISGLGEDGLGVDRADAPDRCQQLVVGRTRQEFGAKDGARSRPPICSRRFIRSKVEVLGRAVRGSDVSLCSRILQAVLAQARCPVETGSFSRRNLPPSRAAIQPAWNARRFGPADNGDCRVSQGRASEPVETDPVRHANLMAQLSAPAYSVRRSESRRPPKNAVAALAPAADGSAPSTNASQRGRPDESRAASCALGGGA